MGGNLKEIRTKIVSVQNTQKTTKAMKLVSSSKLKKAEELAKKSKIFAAKLNAVFDEVVEKVRLRGIESINSRYFAGSKEREIKKVDIVFVTADKGLCGGFNQATIKEVMRLIEHYDSQNIKVRLRGIGKKGIAYFTFNDMEVLDRAIGLSSQPSYEKASEFIYNVVEDFLRGATDEVVLVHNGFKSMIAQEIESRVLMPLSMDEILGVKNGVDSAAAPVESVQKADDSKKESAINIEPDDEEDSVLDELAKKYIEYNMYYALVDSLAAEHSARVQAMDAASNNASDLVKALTIQYNKARQEAITTELVEINAGVEAMK